LGDLSELTLHTSYHKGRDDIAEDFYLPCMRRASEYDRAVAFFRSTVFLIAWPALRDFVQRGGRIRVLCSQVLADEDIEALSAGYSARVDEVLARRFLEEVKELLRDEALRQPARILAGLVATGTLDLQVAILKEADLRSSQGRIFHDKLGLFRDELGNLVSFKGSMNETWNGLASDGNLESVDVAATWMGARDRERARAEEQYFADLWHNDYPTVIVRPFPTVARKEFESHAISNFDEELEQLLSPADRPRDDPRGRSLKAHQSSGLASWRANDRRGILAFATGSGKTFTAITAIREAIREHGEVVVVVVPDREIFRQWYDELVETTRDLGVRILRAGAGHTRWRSSLRLWTAPGEQPRIVLATARTASSDDFRAQLVGGPHMMLVADEVHRLGSPKNQRILEDRLFGARLGLSATPERAGDPDGTSVLMSYFGGVLEPRYTLADAVRDGVLTKYFYRPHTVMLTEGELTEWRLISQAVSQLRARVSAGDATPGLARRLTLKLIQRARIVKHAAGKVPLAVEVLSEHYEPGQRWLVYCDDLVQLEAVCRALLSANLQPLPFHSQMAGDRRGTLEWLDYRGGIVVAIKCLDEGVDIPSVSHALILASSKNPREFIQRRGRVLRTAPNKTLAYVHDAIVVPPRNAAPPGQIEDPITAGELARAIEFAEHAANPASAADLRQVAIDAGIDWRRLLREGVEDED
jgi:superfamily II DNA or RNA helicase